MVHLGVAGPLDRQDRPLPKVIINDRADRNEGNGNMKIEYILSEEQDGSLLWLQSAKYRCNIPSPIPSFLNPQYSFLISIPSAPPTRTVFKFPHYGSWVISTSSPCLITWICDSSAVVFIIQHFLSGL